MKKSLLAKANSEIIELVKSFPGNKALVIDKSLENLLNITLDNKFKSIKDLGVTELYLLTETINFKTDTVIYFTRESRNNLNIIIDQLNSFPKPKYHVYLAPRLSLAAPRLFEMEGVYGKCSFGELRHISLLPTMSILSMDITFNSDIFELYKPAMIHDIGYILKKLGKIPQIYGVGSTSYKIANYLIHNSNESDDIIFDQLILVDRQYDLITPLCTPVSYAGIVRELFPQTQFSAKDTVYAETKYMECAKVGGFLNSLVKNLKLLKDCDKNASDKDTLVKLKNLVDHMKQYQKQHIDFNINIFEKVINAYDKQFMEIEENIKNNNDIKHQVDNYIEKIIMNTIDNLGSKSDKMIAVAKILKLLFLASLYGHNLNWNKYRTTIIQTYGYKYGMIFEKAKEYGFMKDNSTFGDKLTNFITLDSEINTIPKVIKKLHKRKDDDNYFYMGKSIKHKAGKILVFIIGGITYDEIAEIKKWVVPDNKIYIGSTNITSGSEIIRSFAT